MKYTQHMQTPFNIYPFVVGKGPRSTVASFCYGHSGGAAWNDWLVYRWSL